MGTTENPALHQAKPPSRQALSPCSSSAILQSGSKAPATFPARLHPILLGGDKPCYLYHSPTPRAPPGVRFHSPSLEEPSPRAFPFLQHPLQRCGSRPLRGVTKATTAATTATRSNQTARQAVASQTPPRCREGGLCVHGSQSPAHSPGVQTRNMGHAWVSPGQSACGRASTRFPSSPSQPDPGSRPDWSPTPTYRARCDSSHPPRSRPAGPFKPKSLE